MIIEFEDLQVIFTRKKIKNINLRITNGQIRLSASKTHSLIMIYHFLHEKKAWLNKHRDKLYSAELYFNTGESHYFLGNRYSLIIHKSSVINVVLTEQHMHCYAPLHANKATKSEILNSWYQEKINALLPNLITKWQAIIGVTINRWHTKILKSIWGSCNTQKKIICLNVYLIKKPLICIEYVLVHELVHLLEPSHNKRFYQLMSQFMPQWKEYKILLKS